jgi:pimeloyl-ACP methyl ester carboxylesterase
MPDFKNGDVRIYYETGGNGPEVVLVHGFAGSSGGII